MSGPRRAPAPPLRLRLRSGTAARRTNSYHSENKKPDDGWGHFKPSRRGHCKTSRRHLPKARGMRYPGRLESQRMV